MKYQIELAAAAKADISATTRWLRDRSSQSVADRWLKGIYRAINSLGTQPHRCPIAAESDKFPIEIRELLYGKRRNRYRILFTIVGDIVYVTYVRHAARDEL
jgi:plasmid stabilization system protein ParE